MSSALRACLAVAIFVLAVACARTVMPIASPDDAVRAAQTWPGTTSADLEQGRQLYIARCSSCHQPVRPSAMPAAEWPGHVREMSLRANLDAAQMRQVERYLVTMAEAARGPQAKSSARR